jgi:hypothetical protein
MIDHFLCVEEQGGGGVLMNGVRLRDVHDMLTRDQVPMDAPGLRREPPCT